MTAGGHVEDLGEAIGVALVGYLEAHPAIAWGERERTVEHLVEAAKVVAEDKVGPLFARDVSRANRALRRIAEAVLTAEREEQDDTTRYLGTCPEWRVLARTQRRTRLRNSARGAWAATWGGG